MEYDAGKMGLVFIIFLTSVQCRKASQGSLKYTFLLQSVLFIILFHLLIPIPKLMTFQ